MSVPDAQRLKAPEDENRPKKLVANQAGGHQRAEGRRLAKLVTPAARKPFVQDVREEWQLSERRACELMEVSTMAMRYMSRRDDTVLRRRLRELAAQRRRWGYRMVRVLLLREGMHVNHKRVERIYREEGLSVRKRKRAVRAAGTPLLRHPGPTRRGDWTSCRMRCPGVVSSVR